MPLRPGAGRHSHSYGSWSAWNYIGKNTDERTRLCLDAMCSAPGSIQVQTRRHVHGQSYKDIENGKTVRRCMDCNAVT